MNDLSQLSVCPGTLIEGFHTYSPSCRRKLFNGRHVSHVLPFERDRMSQISLQENRKRISISGVQVKSSVRLEKNQLTPADHAGQYILKPVPYELVNRDDIPANEHLTMQIAGQIFGLPTPANALIFFPDGQPAYIVKRFDYKPDGSKLAVEDFASILGRTEQNAGRNFKYDGYYEDVARAMQQHVPSWRVEIEKFFRLVAFNFLFSNGDAHLKNFSLIEGPQGDFVLAPPYDLLCTALHVTDSELALDGLFDGDEETQNFRDNAFRTYHEFVLFGQRIGMIDRRIVAILNDLLSHQDAVRSLLNRSYLSDEGKLIYLSAYEDRLKRFGQNRLISR